MSAWKGRVFLQLLIVLVAGGMGAIAFAYLGPLEGPLPEVCAVGDSSAPDRAKLCVYRESEYLLRLEGWGWEKEKPLFVGLSVDGEASVLKLDADSEGRIESELRSGVEAGFISVVSLSGCLSDGTFVDRS